MKFLHLGDLHIGKSLGDYGLIEDQDYILKQIVDLAVSREVDAVLICGDVYDKSIPSEAAVGLFDKFLNELVSKQIKTFVITGNHDSDERLHFGSSLFEANDVFIKAKYRGEIRKVELSDEHGPVNVFMMPFVKASQVRTYYPEDEIGSYDDAVKAALTHTDIDPAQRNVILAHQFVTGRSGDPECAGSEGLSVKVVGTVEKVGSDCFDMFDYAALGHIHSGQSVGRPEVRYSGSPLKYSQSEVHSVKSVPVVTLGEKGCVDIDLVPLKPLRDVRQLRGEMKTLLSRENVCDAEDYIFVILTDEDYQKDAMSIFREYYPHTVNITYDNSRSREVDHVDISDITEDRSFADIIKDFYSQMYGCDINEEEMALIMEVAGEAGVVHEAD